jgi:BirA family biotin operon repressor/biotin-[acetyl-CoA-carboxylase] ligase
MTWTANLPHGYRVLHVEETGSTNALALDWAREGDPGNLWVVADRQTAGRGRQGRTWVSEPGNLFASLVLSDPALPDRLGELPLVVALAVHDAIADVLPPSARGTLEIKWPNDVLLAGAKLSGVLIESAMLPQGRVVVVGIGVNCRHHPSDTPYPATDLASAGMPTEPAALFERLADRMARRLGEWQGGPFTTIVAAWTKRARGIGEPIRVRLTNRTLEGRFERLDERGRLVLALSGGGTEVISAGDVFFG